MESFGLTEIPLQKYDGVTLEPHEDFLTIELR